MWEKACSFRSIHRCRKVASNLWCSVLREGLLLGDDADGCPQAPFGQDAVGAVVKKIDSIGAQTDGESKNECRWRRRASEVARCQAFGFFTLWLSGGSDGQSLNGDVIARTPVWGQASPAETPKGRLLGLLRKRR